MKPDYWRSLDEYASTPEFEALVHREFPALASEFTDPAGRRQFLRLMAASLALAGAGACTRQPRERIVPYVRQPEEIIPGRPLYFATAMPDGGVAMPLLVESHMGRPTKVEGNPEHPASLGATDAFAQASVLTLYDPDRADTITYRGDVRPWGGFLAAMQLAMTAQRPIKGAGLRILTATVTSPSLAGEIDTLLKELPAATWHQWEADGRDNAREGARLAFGAYTDVIYRFDEADVIVSLDADFLGCGPGHVRYARDFASRRRVTADRMEMNRLYAVASTPTVTGAKADHRLPMRASEIEAFARALAGRAGLSGPPARFATAVLTDLQAHAGRSIVIAGDAQPPGVHALAHAINRSLGNVGRTVFAIEPVDARPVNQLESLRELVGEMRAGTVDVLLVLGGNPVFDAPADLDFAGALAKVGVAVRLGLHRDETAELCHWNIPEAHFLESWGDARAYDGSVCMIQPLIAPLYGGRTASEVLAALSTRPERSAHDIVREYWKSRGVDEKAWRRALHDGFLQQGAGGRGPEAGGSAATARTAGPSAPDLTASAKAAAVRRSFSEGGKVGPTTSNPRPPAPGLRPPTSSNAIEIMFRPDPTIRDGRHANNGWLQELPKPLTKLTWDAAAYISPGTARRLGLANEDVVELRATGRSIRMPIWIVPGHADDSVTVHFGYGRRRAGRVGTNTGFDAYPLRTSNALWIASGEIVKTGARYRLAVTQDHHLMENRNVVRAATLEAYRREPEIVKHMGHAPPKTLTMYPEYEYTGNKWGMSIDLNACTGCNACMVACQSENNVPVVGKDQVLVNREMHWLRIDTYYKGNPDNPETYHQPVPCMHCENAPCEVVCPVAATAHSDEGLNDMVYNRCVGTRYCSNNCPYKVRRFNFLLYQDWATPSLQLGRNPDVTVRSRGVMEKCTYCVQRINEARIQAKTDGRAIRDGEVVTACQQACPTQAIVFGNLNDPGSQVTKLKAEPRDYGLLEDLNTRPRTTYLAALRNPNPEVEKT